MEKKLEEERRRNQVIGGGNSAFAIVESFVVKTWKICRKACNSSEALEKRTQRPCMSERRLQAQRVQWMPRSKQLGRSLDVSIFVLICVMSCKGPENHQGHAAIGTQNEPGVVEPSNCLRGRLEMRGLVASNFGRWGNLPPFCKCDPSIDVVPPQAMKQQVLRC